MQNRKCLRKPIKPLAKVGQQQMNSGQRASTKPIVFEGPCCHLITSDVANMQPVGATMLNLKGAFKQPSVMRCDFSRLLFQVYFR